MPMNISTVIGYISINHDIHSFNQKKKRKGTASLIQRRL